MCLGKPELASVHSNAESCIQLPLPFHEKQTSRTIQCLMGRTTMNEIRQENTKIKLKMSHVGRELVNVKKDSIKGTSGR